MLKTQKTISINGNITTTINGKEENIMSVSANIPDDGNPSINQYIQNKELYLKNKEIVSSDLKEFETIVNNMMEV